jgi:hypothetical protein
LGVVLIAVFAGIYAANKLKKKYRFTKYLKTKSIIASVLVFLGILYFPFAEVYLFYFWPFLFMMNIALFWEDKIW